MTTTENRPSKQDEIESRARKIADEWIVKDEDSRMIRARSVARRQVERERLAALEADPAYWVRPMMKAGVQGLAQTWAGAPIPADLCIVRDGFWSIEADGIWVTPEGHPKQFVCSPIAETSRGGAYVALVGKKWVEIPRPAVEGHPSPRMYADMVLATLRQANVSFGETIVSGYRSDALDHVPAAVYALCWLTGFDRRSESIGCSPVRRFAKVRRDDDRPDGVEARQALGEVLTRMPRDVRPR